MRDDLQDTISAKDFHQSAPSAIRVASPRERTTPMNVGTRHQGERYILDDVW